MIDKMDIDAFEAENREAFRAAAKFAERQARGLPPDRWASADFQAQVAKGIQAQAVLIAALAAALKALADDE